MQGATYEGVRSVRILVEQGATIRRLCRLAWAADDASLYILPYGVEGRFHFGQASVPASEASSTVPFNDQETSASMPKLSLHESGQVHIKAGSAMVGPMYIPPLADLRGQHVATATCSRFEALPLFEGEPKTTGSVIDLAVPASDALESGRCVIYINGQEPVFAGAAQMQARFVRPSLDQPLYVGFLTVGQAALNDGPDSDSVIVTAGWNPGVTDVSAPMDYMFIVAK